MTPSPLRTTATRRLRSIAVGGLVLAAGAFVPAEASHLVSAPYGSAIDTAQPGLRLNGAGHPVISYYASGALYLATCTANCTTSTASWTYSLVDNVPGVSSSVVLTPSGEPVVSYQDTGTGKFWVATCTSGCTTPSPTWARVKLDQGDNQMGAHSSLQIDGSGRIAVSYYASYSYGELKVASCTGGCAIGANWTVRTVDDGMTNGGRAGRYSSLRQDGDSLWVSYAVYDDLNRGGIPAGLRVAQCTANCYSAASSWSAFTVDGDFTGQASALALDGSGKPVVSYYDNLFRTLKLATCTGDCTTAGGWVKVTVDGGGVTDAGWGSSVQFNGDGNPVVSYFDATTATLKYAICTAGCATPSPSWRLMLIDSTVAASGRTALQLDPAGIPMVAYQDSSAAYLQLALVDLVPPSVLSIVRSGPNPTNAASVGFTVTFDDTVSGVDAGDFTLTTSGLTGATVTGAAMSGDGSVWTVDVNTGIGSGTVRLDLVDNDTISDGLYELGGPGAGNGSYSLGESYTIDRKAPAVSSVGVPAALTYHGGTTLQFAVNFDENVIVGLLGGTPALPFTISGGARTAEYVGGDGTSALLFAYAVQAGDMGGIALGAALATHGGTLRDAATNDALLALNGVPDTSGIVIDAPLTFTVTPGAGAHGTIAPDLPQTVVAGAAATFTVTADPGYSATMGGSCVGSLAGATYILPAVTADCTVAASFNLNSYTVTPSAGTHGTIAPATPTPVDHGGTLSFTVTPEIGYSAIVGGSCGGTLTGNTYTTQAVTAGCTVDVSFNPKRYTVTPSAGAHGTVAPATPTAVDHGGTLSFTVTPENGYTATVGGSCGGTLAGNSYTTQAVTADCTVDVSFNLNRYTVTPSAGAHGTITPATPTQVDRGGILSFTVTPEAGYGASVSGSCSGTLTGDTYTTQAITADCTVEARFAAAVPALSDRAAVLLGGLLAISATATMQRRRSRRHAAGRG